MNIKIMKLHRYFNARKSGDLGCFCGLKKLRNSVESIVIGEG